MNSSQIIPVVRAAGFKKYDKIVHSFVMHSDDRGVTLRPEALAAVAEVFPEFAAEIAGGTPKRKHKEGRRRKPNHFRCRLDDAAFATVKRWMAEDGIQTQQEFLEECIRCYGVVHGKDFL